MKNKLKKTFSFQNLNRYGSASSLIPNFTRRYSITKENDVEDNVLNNKFSAVEIHYGKTEYLIFLWFL